MIHRSVLLAHHARGDDVRELQETLEEIGFPVPRSEFEAKLFGLGTREALCKLQKRFKLPPSGVLDPVTRKILEVALKECRTPGMLIEGQLFFDYGAPAPGVPLRLFHLEFGGERILLSEGTSNESGFFSLTYPSLERTHLQIAVVDRNGNDVPLHRPLYGASGHETLNLAVPSDVGLRPGEFRALTEALEEAIDDPSRIADAEESGERRDLTFLHASTGWDARLLGLAGEAFRLSRRLELDPEILYGLFREGIPSDPVQLAALPPGVVEKALERAREQGIVEVSPDAVRRFADDFTRVSRDQRLSWRASTGLGTLKQFIDRVELSTGDEETLAAALHRFEGNPDELWDELREEGLSEARIQRIQRVGALSRLTGDNPLLVGALDNLLGREDPDGSGVPLEREMAVLADRGLYRAEEWSELLEQLSQGDPAALSELLPPGPEGVGVEERLRAYSNRLAEQVSGSFPTRVIRDRISRGDLPLPGPRRNGDRDPSGGPESDEEPTRHLLRLLDDADALGLRIGATALGPFLADHGEELLEQIPEEARGETVETLRTLQRLYQITPSDDSMRTLLELGYTSALEIGGMDQERFLARHGRDFDPEDGERSRLLATLVHRRAVQISNTVLGVYGAAAQQAFFPHMASTPAQEDVAPNPLIRHLPSLEGLFGSQDYCECEHCASVLSPAAYLVDLLRFIDPPNPEWEATLAHWSERHGGAPYPFASPAEHAGFVERWEADHPGEPVPDTELKPYEVLLQRRPDLPHLPLSCANTHTALPHIDLVNEILEYFVAEDGSLSPEAARDTGESSSEELLAEPRHLIPEAYDRLLEARYPLDLPFDLWLEMGRAFLRRFDVEPARLLEILRRTEELHPPLGEEPGDHWAPILYERLGLGPAEVAILTDPDPVAGWVQLFGYASAASALNGVEEDGVWRLRPLASAGSLTRRLGITPGELVRLVRARWINPELASLAVLQKLGIETTQVFRYFEAPGHLPLPATERTAFEALLNELSATYADRGFEAREWLEEAWDAGSFNDVLVLHHAEPECDLDSITLRFADGRPAGPVEFLKLHHFVRIWRRLGWSLEEVDLALHTFTPEEIREEGIDADTLGAAVRSALLHISALDVLEEKTATGPRQRKGWLTLWGDLSTSGPSALYSRLFLNSGVLRTDPVFDHPLGLYLQDPGPLLSDHLASVQGALRLTAGEVERILASDGQELASAPLSMTTVSRLHRHAFLARTLKIGVEDLLELQEITGIDPFAPVAPEPVEEMEELAPHRHTLAFVEAARTIRGVGLTIPLVGWLLGRTHEAPPPWTQDPSSRLSYTASLREEILDVLREFGDPPEPGGVDDERLARTLALVLDPSVVDIVMSMWTGTMEYSSSVPGVEPAAALDPAEFPETTGIATFYDPVREEQRLLVRGVMTPNRRAALEADHPSPLVAELLEGVEAQARGFFESHLEVRMVGAEEYGFLEGPDLEGLFGPLPNGLSEADAQAVFVERRQRLVEAFFPFLRRRLIHRRIVDHWEDRLDLDPQLVTDLLSQPELLEDPGEAEGPLWGAFAALSEEGLTVEWFETPDASGPPLATDTVTAHELPDAPAGTQSLRIRAALAVPTGGPYRFFLGLEGEEIRGELRFRHLQDALIQLQTPAAAGPEVPEADSSDFLHLEAGRLYPFRVDAQLGAGDRLELSVQGETLPRGPLVRLAPLPGRALERTQRAGVRLRKAAALVGGLELGPREVGRLARTAEGGEGFDLNTLPLESGDAGGPDPAELWEDLAPLLSYHELRRRGPDRPEAWIRIMEAARRTEASDADPAVLEGGVVAGVAEGIAELVRQPPEAVERLFAHFGWEAESQVVDEVLVARLPEASEPGRLLRLLDALELVGRLRIPVESVLQSRQMVDLTLPREERMARVRELRDAVKARFAPDEWLRVARPIFDDLRGLQRDALTAWVRTRQGLDGPEQLFEYFLLDPGMEPVVQTSRIRAAIGSVQTFIQRSLMNLEPGVAPGVIDADQWRWMSRYRIWEANRKIFLFPENWLEPEFRDDKTHLFDALEGTLLQDEVDERQVEDALVDYLRGLEEIAKLRIVATWWEEDPVSPSLNTLHVVGRTTHHPRTHFYRRYVHGAWTPWEPIPVQIDGEHLVLMKWQDRLHLFWVTLVEKAGQTQNSASQGVQSTAISDLEFSELTQGMAATRVTRRVEASLNWCEYFNGEWNEGRKDGFSSPAVRTLTGTALNPRLISIAAEPRYDEEGGELELMIHLQGPINVSFRFVSRHAPLNSRTGEWEPSIPYRFRRYSGPVGAGPSHPGPRHLRVEGTRLWGREGLNVRYRERVVTSLGGFLEHSSVVADQEVLRRSRPRTGRYFLTFPNHPLLRPNPEFGPLRAPFFYDDDENLFMVVPTLVAWSFVERPLPDVSDLVGRVNGLDPRVFEELHVIPDSLPPRVPFPPDPIELHPEALIPLTPREDWLVQPGVVLRVGDTLLGREGMITAAALPEPDESENLAWAEGGGRLETGWVVQAPPVAPDVMPIRIIGSGGLFTGLSSPVLPGEHILRDDISNPQGGVR